MAVQCNKILMKMIKIVIIKHKKIKYNEINIIKHKIV